MAIASVDKIDGLEYVVRKLNDIPLPKTIAKQFDLYEIYFENRTNKTFSIPGYSVDVGVSYFNSNQVSSFFKDSSSKKLAVFNLAAGAASIALSGIARTAANTAFRSVGSLKGKAFSVYDDSVFLSPNKTYILYPNTFLSILLFVDKYIGYAPNSIRFICRDEELNLNFIVINDKIDLREINAYSNEDKEDKEETDEATSKDVIASPNTDSYK